ncbi:MAG: NAD(P)H-hydrate dehydratase [Paracoccaceae bacterium]
MTDLLTARSMRALENNAMAGGFVTGLELMERAGQGVVDGIFAQWPELGQVPHLAMVVCGPGNNGGDGFVIARLLRQWGWDVEVFFRGNVAKLSRDARANFDRWEIMGPVQSFEDLNSGDARARMESFLNADAQHPPIVIDALFGAGLSRPVTDGVICPNTGWFNGLNVRSYHIGVDGPSGLCLDSGRALGGHAIRCALSVSFERPKQGHYLAQGPEYCGALRIAKIGVGASVPDWPDDAPLPPKLVTPGSDAGWPLSASVFDKDHRGHKYTSGHALVLSGGMGRSGAARLAARAALRIGAGLVTIGAPPSAQMEIACQITALMLTRIDGPEALLEILNDARLNALCLGPGLGLERARDLVPAALTSENAASHSVVLDADALSAYADEPAALFAMLNENCVLTPHGGEFARLFPDLAAELSEQAQAGPAYSRVDAVREAAKRAGCVVLLKGADTVIADPQGACFVHAAQYERTAPWLATAGSGDVLAGIITGLLARGFTAMDAAAYGAWLHVETARSFGPGLIAEDLAEQLPLVLEGVEF